MKTVITTVGLSIFSNYFDKEKNTNSDSSITPHYEKLKNKPASEWVSFLPRINKLKPKILKWAKNNKEASAEIKSFLAIREDLNDNLIVYLLTTDTILSALAAEIIKDVFRGDNKIDVKFDCNLDIIKGLQVVDARKFSNEVLFNLINRIEHIQNDTYGNIVFNITGGYKGVIPYLTIMAQIYDCELHYIFEETDELIRIRKMPIDFDFSIIEENYIAFESLNKTKEDNLPTISEFKNNLSENLEEQENEYSKLEKYNLISANAEKDKVKFTVLGKLFFKQIHPSVLRQIKELNDKYTEKAKNLKWYHLKLRENYKSNVDWKVDASRIKEL